MPKLQKRSLRPLHGGLLAILMLVLLILARCGPRHDQTATVAAIAAGQTVPVLMYHHLLPKSSPNTVKDQGIVCYVEDFADQLDWLQKNGYHTISTDELEAFLYEGAVLPEHPVMLTFDDGYLSNYRYAAPLLREYGFTAVIFPVTSRIAEEPVTVSPDGGIPQDRAAMQGCADVLEYASHTHELHRYTGSGRSALTDADTDTVRADLCRSLEVLATIPGSTDKVFAYPYGAFNDRVKTVLRENGVRMAFRASAGLLTRDCDPYALPRIPISHTVDMEDFARLLTTYTKAG